MAKQGLGIQDILDAIVNRIPAPTGDPQAPLQALIFDSIFNSFRGVVANVRIMNGTLKQGDRVRFVNTGNDYELMKLVSLKWIIASSRRIGGRQCRLCDDRGKDLS